MKTFRSSVFVCALITLVAGAQQVGDLAKNFASPPPAARPWVYWFPLDGNITSNGITADLEAMARAGIGGVLYMETEQGTPRGPAAFGGHEWRDLIKFATKEANRLGLEINMNNDAGWCGSGGPWITPELSMQKIIWSETAATGPTNFAAVLAQPKANKDFYQDIAVFAFPTPEKKVSIAQLSGKSAATKEEIPLRATFTEPPKEAVTPRDKILNLTDKLGADGKLAWDVPAGKWTILRVGHTTTGKDNHPAPMDGRGLECDKLSKEAADAHFNGLMQKLIDDNGPLAGKTLVSTHIDSWEVGSQNWTPKFREDFKRLRGYDPMPFLPVIAGIVVDSLEISERFLWDVRMTVNDLLMENYAGEFRRLANKNGLRLSIEAYDGSPTDDLTYGGQADEPMAEFWSWSKFGAAYSCTEMSSSAHVYGKKILGAESFTASNSEKWQGHPAMIKELGDWAFCEGINRFVFHRYALQPWTNRPPGVSMGPWGLHYERTQTWWEQSKAWHEYLARCQYLLQQGLFVADLCFLVPENSPQRFKSPVKGSLERPGYNFDGCPPEVVLTRMSVKDGRIVLPDGMSYRMLVLPQTEMMSPKLLGKIKELIEAGATVVGVPPAKSPGLGNYPQCDDEVKKLANEIWGEVKSSNAGSPIIRALGKGRVIWTDELMPQKTIAREAAPVAGLTNAKWIWLKEGNPAASAPPGHRYFRRVFEAKGPVATATLTMSVDNVYECWINGKRVCDSDNFKEAKTVSVAKLLKPGKNIIAVLAENTDTTPNPAGLIAVLKIKYSDGKSEDIASDATWEASKSKDGEWKTDFANNNNWTAAMELGPYGMHPWGEISQPQPGPTGDPIPNINSIIPLLANDGVPPDLDSTPGLRHIHKIIGDADVYFVANKNPENAETVCSFRVAGKRPEIWHPDTGRMEPVAAYETKDGVTRIPLRFEPSGSLFVVFRPGTKAFDPAVSFARDGSPVMQQTSAGGKIEIQKAMYGVLGDAAKTRDVKTQVQALVDSGVTSFKVAKMAEDVDPAFQIVKTLAIEYTINGQSLKASATDTEMISLGKNIPATEATATLHVNDVGEFVIEAEQAGHYEIKTAAGKTLSADVAAPPPVFDFGGAWDVSFEPNRGAPASAKFDKLISWSESADAGIKYFSGHATYRKKFEFNGEIPKSKTRVYLDLGKVEVMAEVKLNGKDLGILWKPPYRIEVTDTVKAGVNELEVRVVNLWINRLIGDEQLTEDGDRNANGTLKSWPQFVLEDKPSPTGRFAFTSWKLWKKGDPLVPSGLLGPVTMRACTIATPH